MTKQISRRQFLKAAAAGGMTAAFAPLFGFSLPLVRAKQRVPERVMQQVADPMPFNALPSTTPLAAPLADISMGADGTIWAIDTNGVPFSYDQLSQTWEVYVDQIDAITTTSRWKGISANGGGKYAQPLVVMGAQITSPVDGSPLALGDAFSGLPDSFAFGLDGIAEVNGLIYLFRHGRYVTVDTSTATNAVVGNPVALTSLTDWPTTLPWSSGTFQALGSCFDNASYSIVHLFNSGQVLVVDLLQGKVTLALPYATYAFFNFRSKMEQGFSALSFSASGYPKNLYQGGIQYQTDSSDTVTSTYANIAQAAGWTPVLAHAPSGSGSELWGVTTNTKVPVLNTGSGWQFGPYDAAFEQCTAISAGADGSVFCLTSDGSSWGPRQLQQNSTWSAPLTVTTTQLVQLEVGDANHIWVLGANSTIYRYNSTSKIFDTVPGFQAATHLAANADGTVWAANGDNSAYRFISEGTSPASSIAVADVGTVIKVASNAFAAAVALVQNGDQTQAHSYDSQYVWKTSASYIPRQDYQGLTQSIEFSGHTVFTVSSYGVDTISALDAQTGVTLWTHTYERYTFDPSIDLILDIATALTLSYDQALNLLYVSGGRFLDALDAATGALVWQFDPRTAYSNDVGLMGPAIVSGGVLAASERITNSLILFDTAASQTNRAPQTIWSKTVDSSPTQGNGLIEDWMAVGTPVFGSRDAIYLVSQVAGSTVDVGAFNLSDGNQIWHQALPAAQLQIIGDGSEFYNKLPLDGVMAETNNPNPTPTAPTIPALLVNAGLYVYALNLDSGATIRSYTLPQTPNTDPVFITSGLGYLNNQLFFGDSQAQLTTVNTLTMSRTARTSNGVSSWLGVTGQPTLIHTDDPNDGLVVFFVCGDTNLWLFDPSNNNLESLATDQTSVAAMTYDETHGLLYATGLNSNDQGNANSLGQVFAVRPDQAIQDERDFIIESQLMQDYHSDDEATNSNGAPRYQTHVTIVDDNSVPMSNASIKLWAEEDGTVVSIDGNDPITIGPNTPALFTTDSSGSFTVISGGYNSDGSDAADLFASTLQVWAAFMDSSERITITPDAEFHGRVAATTASGNTNASQADPNGIDLSSTQSYDGTPLFSTSSTDQSAASTMAGAMTQVTGAVGAGTGGSAALLRRTLGGSLLPQQTATPPKYHAYTDLPGMRYNPIGAFISQGLNPTTPLSVSFANGSATISNKPGDAADIIDAMQGDPTTSQLGGFLSDLRSAWNDIKKAATEVKNAAISIAKEVYVGITYVVDGVTKVVKAVAADIKDAMATIGAFFKQLGRLIENAIEALSILLHFDEFIKTQQYIKGKYTAIVGDPDPSKGIPGVLAGNVNRSFDKIQNFLGGLEGTIDGYFNGVIGKLQSGPSTGVGDSSGTWGQYTTSQSPHSMMTVAPADGSGSKKSVAVQGMWAAHKARQNAKGTTIPSSLGDSQSSIVNALLSMFTSQADTFSNLNDVKSQFAAGISVKSPQAFFDGIFADVLILLKAALVGSVDALSAVVGALQGVSDAIIAVIQAGGPIYIPIITPLWNKLRKVLPFLPDIEITIIDVITLIAALPVTLIYRVVSGHWLSQDAASVSINAVGVTPPQWLVQAEGVITAVITMVNGFIAGISDTLSILSASFTTFTPSPWVTIAGYASMGAMMLSPIYNAAAANGDAIYDLVIGLNVMNNIISIYNNNVKNPLSSLLSWGLAICILIVQWIADGSFGQPVLTIVSDILSNIPGCLAICKEVSDPASIIPFISPLADVICGLAAGGLGLAAIITNWNPPSETEHRIYFPISARS